MKELLKQGMGDGALVISVDQGQLELKAQFPVAKILEPMKAQIFDKVKAAIPGTWDDALIDALYEAMVKALSEV